MSRPGKQQADQDNDPALYKFQKSDARTALDLNLVCQLPKSVLPSRIRTWLRENCVGYWQIHYPQMGHATWKNTVILFEFDDDCDAYRRHYCYDSKFHKYNTEADWGDTMLDNK